MAINWEESMVVWPIITSSTACSRAVYCATWSGWYPHSVVHGKNSEKTGLVVLSSTTVTAVEPADKLATTWGNLKSAR